MKSKPKVLITEDNRVSRAILSKLVKNLKFEVCVAENGNQAIELERKEIPDLILVDVDMPGIDGYQTCEALRKQCKSHVPIIFLSGKNRKEDILKGYDSGGSDFIVKPFDQEELSQKIKIAVDRKLEVDDLEQNKSGFNLSTLSQVAKLKHVADFCKQVFICNNFETLVKQLFKTLNFGLGLKATLQIRLDRYAIIQTDDDVDRPLDEKIIQDYRHDGDIYHFKTNSTLFNQKDFSLLVRNIDEEEEHVSILLDVFAVALVRINDIEQQGTGPTLDVGKMQHEIEESFDRLAEKMEQLFNDAATTSSISEKDENQLLRIITEEKGLMVGTIKQCTNQ